MDAQFITKPTKAIKSSIVPTGVTTDHFVRLFTVLHRIGKKLYISINYLESFITQPKIQLVLPFISFIRSTSHPSDINVRTVPIS